jgi:hypothetical protein
VYIRGIYDKTHLTPLPKPHKVFHINHPFFLHEMEKVGSKRERPLFTGEAISAEKRPRIDIDHVQITATTEEVADRIKAFVSSKRELVNLSNRREFRSSDPAVLESKQEPIICCNTTATSARTDAQKLNREDQIRRYSVEDDGFLIDIEGEDNSPVSQRLTNLESYLFDPGKFKLLTNQTPRFLPF